MSLIFMDGFDDGLYGQKWNALVLGSIGSPGRTGSGSYYQAYPSGGPRARKILGTDSHATIGLGCGFINAGQHPWADAIHFGADGGATKHIGVTFLDDGAILVGRGGTYGDTRGTEIVRSATGRFLNNIWNHIEIKVVLHDTTGAVVVRVNNVEVINFTGDTKNGGTEAVISDVMLGTSNGGTYIPASFDDVFIWNGAGSVNNDFLGDCAVRTLYPNGNGDLSQLVGSDGNSTDNYLLVDEASPNTTDYVGSATADEQDLYLYPDLPAASAVKGVVVNSYVAKSDAGAIAARHVGRSGTPTDVNSADVVLTTSYVGHRWFLDQNPDGNVAWTPAAFNAYQWGVQARA